MWRPAVPTRQCMWGSHPHLMQHGARTYIWLSYWYFLSISHSPLLKIKRLSGSEAKPREWAPESGLPSGVPEPFRSRGTCSCCLKSRPPSQSVPSPSCWLLLYFNPTIWHGPSTDYRALAGQGLHVYSWGSDSRNNLKGLLVSSHLAEKTGLVSRGEKWGPKWSFKKKGFDLRKSKEVLFYSCPRTPKALGIYRIELCFFSQPCLPRLHFFLLTGSLPQTSMQHETYYGRGIFFFL